MTDILPVPFAAHETHCHVVVGNVFNRLHIYDLADGAFDYFTSNRRVERGLTQDMADAHFATKATSRADQLLQFGYVGGKGFFQ